MADSAPTPLDIFRQKLVATQWRFGPHWGEASPNHMIFADSGKIENYQHPNERSWGLRHGRLEIYDAGEQLMWVAASMFIEEQKFCILLKSPRDDTAAFILREAGSRPVPVYAPAPLPAPAPAAAPAALPPAAFLFPTDLRVTETKLQRVLLIGSCMTALYHEQFQLDQPQTKFDYLVFNYAGALAPPPADLSSYDLQYVQLPLRSVLTDRVVWAMQFNDAGFAEDVLTTGYQVIDAMLESALAYNRSHGLLTFVSNFIAPQMSIAPTLGLRHSAIDIVQIVRRLNEYLTDALQRYKNVYLADVNGIAESIGKQYILDDMINFYAHNGAFFREWVGYERPARIEAIPPMDDFYASKRLEFTQAVYAQMIALLRSVRQIDQVKAVIFDLDNTLWRGQIAEDYRTGEDAWPHTDGWPLGIWEAVHHLRARGILVSICSKNDEETVRRDWDNVVQPGFIKLDDFISPKINWRTKAENILDICAELNIKPKSVVFVDDNPVERAAVQAAIPEIRVIGANPYLTRRILLWAPETQIATLTEESTRREDMIRSQIIREGERAVLSRDAFLQSLQCRVAFLTVSHADQPEFSRVVELVNKTNQFNTTGKRWSQAEILAFIAGGGLVTAFRVADRFTDYGLVGVLFCKDLVITQFVMSCRVMGMDVEVFAASFAVNMLRADQGLAEISAVTLETKDNSPCRDIYMRAGFAAAEDGRYVLPVGAMPVVPAHIERVSI
jgi:FkbH-like protein